MKTIIVNFLDKVINEELDKNSFIKLLENVHTGSLEFSNTGFCLFKITEDSDIILQYTIINPANFSFSYDENIPNRRDGAAYYSFVETEDSKIIDAGDENYLPQSSIVNKEKAPYYFRIF